MTAQPGAAGTADLVSRPMHLDTGINEQWFLAVNDFARHSTGLHPPMIAMAQYGVVLFGALLLVQHAADPGFPSDHAVMAGAAAGGSLLVSRRLGLWAAVAAALLAFSRVYVGVHYPGDVAAGLSLGLAVALLGWLLLRAPLTVLTEWLRKQPGVRSVLAAPEGAPARSERTIPV